MKNYFIILAYGQRKRFNSKKPKQFITYKNKALFEHSLYKAIESNLFKKIILVVNDKKQIKKKYPKNVLIIKGGKERSDSSLIALKYIKKFSPVNVLIHDAARPWLRRSHFEDLLHQLTNDQSVAGIFPVIPATDSLRMKKGKDLIPVEREQFLHVQTPQIFYYESLKEAFNKLKKEDLHMSDESQVMENAGFKLLAATGQRSNIKITFTDDIANYAGRDFRIGRGIDFHQFQPGDGLTLGNVFIDCELSIIAHSDGDIILHAISDALLGAAGLRDIGYYFPDSDPKNKNLSSLIIIERSLDLLKDNGLWPRNIDFVVVCENPKIGPYVNQIKKSLSAILKIEESFIGVKATTTEKMGVIGDGNGIAVYAIASLRNKE